MDVLSTIPNINMGGCGISALSMYVWLQEYKHATPQILFCYKPYSKNTYDNNKKLLKTPSILSVPNHIVLIYNYHKIDSDGVLKDFKETYKYWHKVSLKKLVDTIMYSNNWNPAFKRHKNIKKIEKCFEIKLPLK